MTEHGRYIVIEGSDGTGKSTVANLMAERLRSEGREVIRVDEPDSALSVDNEILVPIASELRRIIKDGSLARTALTNVLLFTASRRENWLQVSSPALEQGVDVISARNYWSTLVYQGYGEGFGLETIEYFTRLAMTPQYMRPSNGFILSLNDEEERQRRIASRGALETPDTFESKGDQSQQKILSGYNSVAKSHEVPIISVENRTPEEITDHIMVQIL